MDNHLEEVLATLWVDDPGVHRVTTEKLAPDVAPAFEMFLRHATREMNQRFWLEDSLSDTHDPVQAKIDRQMDVLVRNLRATALVWIPSNPEKLDNRGWLIGTNYVIHTPGGFMGWQKRSVILPINFIDVVQLRIRFLKPPSIEVSLKELRTELVAMRDYFGSSQKDRHFLRLSVSQIQEGNREKLLSLLTSILVPGRKSGLALFESFNQPRVLCRKWATEMMSNIRAGQIVVPEGLK